MSEYLEVLLWLLLVGGIWSGVIIQSRQNRNEKLPDFLKYKF